MLKGRLGLEKARVPHADRHGLIWLGRGGLSVVDGTLRFVTAGTPSLPPGEYDIPYQIVSMILLGPGTTVSHDVMRLAARHGVNLVAVGEDGVRMYSAPPFGPDDSRLARLQVKAWAESGLRNAVARHMYSWRLNGKIPDRDIAKLRGLEGAHMRASYKLAAQHYGIRWQGRRYDRNDPDSADPPNQALNHASSAVQAAAEIAVAATATIPQLGFIHEGSSRAFVLDIADLFRHNFTIPIAFQGVRNFLRDTNTKLESHVRKLAGRDFNRQGLIPQMIDRIKELFDAHDSGGD